MPNTGLQQFWETNSAAVALDSSGLQESSSLWSHVIFCHENDAMIQKKFFIPSMQQCYEYMNSMELSQTEADNIELATRGQATNKLWLALHNDRITRL